MKTAEYMRNVRAEWQAAFVRFVETGDAEEDFLNYLNNDEDAQHAVEAAFNAQADAFQNMADEFKRNENLDDTRRDNTNPEEAEVEKAVEGVLLLSPTQRSEVVHRTASALRASLRPAQQKLLVETLTKAVIAVDKAV